MSQTPDVKDPTTARSGDLTLTLSPTLTPTEPSGARDRRITMLVDTNAVHALGTDCSNQADELCAAAAALTALPGPDIATVFGAVGTRFLATLADAIASEARAVALLGDALESTHAQTGVVADAYSEADRRGSRLL